MTIETVAARDWRLQGKRYRLEGTICPHCQAPSLSSPPICSECGGETKTQFAFNGKGKVYSYTTMPDAPSPSALITSPDYDKVSETSHALREVKPYSKMLLPEVALEGQKTERTIIYQSMDSLSV
jgi:uncharacterized OB-fold protein